MQQHLNTSQWIPFPIEGVFRFFADPHNLPLLMPPKLDTHIERLTLVPPPPNPRFPAADWPPKSAPSDQDGRHQAAGAGSRVEVSFRPIPYVPLRVSWEAHITEFAWYDHFCDEQAQGPFHHFHHRHGFRPEVQQGRIGTLLTDDVHFELPLGAVGRVGSFAVRSQLARTFAIRQQRLPMLLEAAGLHRV